MTTQQKLLNHKAFQLFAVVEKLPLQIECLTCFQQTFILGLTTGQLLVYTVNYNEKLMKLDVTLERSIKSITKKPIQQLMSITDFNLNILVALYDSQVHIFDLITYQYKTTLQKTKNAQIFSIYIPSVPSIKSSSTKNQDQCLQLCVVCKKKMHIFYLDPVVSKNEFMELYTDIELNDIPRTIDFIKPNLILYSIRKDYFLYELPPKANKELFGTGTRTIDPLCYRLNTNKSIALCCDEAKTILLDTNCKPVLKYPLVWSASPSSICNIGPFMIGLIPQSNSIEVITVEPESVIVQSIEFLSSGQSSAASSNAVQSSSFTNSPSSFLLSKVAPALESVANTVSSATSSLTTSLQSTTINHADRLKLIYSSATNSLCYIITQSNVWCLLPINANDQLELLAKSHNYELALSLIKSYTAYMDANASTTKAHNSNPFTSPNVFVKELNQDLIVKIENEFALHIFCQKQFVESMKHFELLKTDPTCIIAFVPGLLPDKFRTNLINYKDFKLPDLVQANDQKMAIDALIDYLQYKRKELLKVSTEVQVKKDEFLNKIEQQQLSLYSLIDQKFINKTRKSILEIIDTTLLQCYLRTREQLVQNLLRRENNYFHLDESERLLKTHKRLVELVILYEKKGLHDRALQLLLQESANQQSQLFGLGHLVKYMKKLGNKNLDLVLKYAKRIFEKEPFVGLEIFINVKMHKVEDDEVDDDDDDDTNILKNLNREKICTFLQTEISSNDGDTSISLLIKYLEHLIYYWNDTSEYINNLLILYYKKKLLAFKQDLTTMDTSSEYAEFNKKLLKFLYDANNYDINYALNQFNEESEEKAILLGKCGKHLEAIRIYVETLNKPDKAESYCNNVYNNESFKDNKKVFYYLLKIYLNSENDEIRIKASTDLLNKHSNKIDSCLALEIIPADMIKCKNLAKFLESMLDSVLYKKRKLQVTNYLTFSLNLQVHELRINKQQNKFFVQDENLCKLCNKRLGKSAIVRYPDGNIIHYGCCKDQNVFNS